MTEKRDRQSIEELDARIKQARGTPHGLKGGGAGRPLGGAALGLAMRVSVEMVASFVVAGGIGLLLDRWLGTGAVVVAGFSAVGRSGGHYERVPHRATGGAAGRTGSGQRNRA